MPASPARSAATATRPTSAPSPTPGSSPQQNSPQQTHQTPKSDPASSNRTPHPPNTDSADTDTAAVGDVGAEGFVGLVLADSAYASGEALDAFTAAGYDTAIKPIDPKPRITAGFTRDDFTIDTDVQTVTCPAGHTKAVTSAAPRQASRMLGRRRPSRLPFRGAPHRPRRRHPRHLRATPRRHRRVLGRRRHSHSLLRATGIAAAVRARHPAGTARSRATRTTTSCGAARSRQPARPGHDD